MRNKRETHLHFVGIGGIGMSGIAEVFLNQGYRVTGSDLSESEVTRRLAQLGARIAIGHHAENVPGAHVVVVSSAIRDDNTELLAAQRLRIPVIPRAEMLGELMRGKTGIAVAGSHGKTTTTSMLASVMGSAGLDPTVVVGGKVDSLGGNAKLGQGTFVVAEADESDGSFLHLPAMIGIITNIDNDHLDHFGNIAAIEDAFVGFVGKLPFYGVAAVCGEDPGVRRCLHRWTKPVATYGLSEEWDFFAKNIRPEGLQSSFEIFGRNAPGTSHRRLGEIRIRVPGKHNVLNALAVTSVAMHLDLPFSTVQNGLAEYGGVRRRFELKYLDTARNRVIIDDYGHHPTEIASTLAAARGYWPGRILTIFQPHRYTRTLHCHDGFLSAFHQSDLVLITDIYPGGEDPIHGVTASALTADIQKVTSAEVQYVGELATAQARALELIKDGDMVLCLGAGSITRLAEQLAKEIAP